MDCHTRCSVQGHRKVEFSLDHSNLEFVWGQPLVEESQSACIRRQFDDRLTCDTRRCRIGEVRKKQTLCLVDISKGCGGCRRSFNVAIDWQGRTVSTLSVQGLNLTPCTQSRMKRLLTTHGIEQTTHKVITIMEEIHQYGSIEIGTITIRNCKLYTRSDANAGHVLREGLRT
jgi:hypothetical protein